MCLWSVCTETEHSVGTADLGSSPRRFSSAHCLLHESIAERQKYTCYCPIFPQRQPSNTVLREITAEQRLNKDARKGGDDKSFNKQQDQEYHTEPVTVSQVKSVSGRKGRGRPHSWMWCLKDRSIWTGQDMGYKLFQAESS